MQPAKKILGTQNLPQGSHAETPIMAPVKTFQNTTNNASEASDLSETPKPQRIKSATKCKKKNKFSSLLVSCACQL